MKSSPPIKLNDPAVLVGGGSINSEALYQILERELPIVAADGGANHLHDLNVTPDVIIGDMDSIRRLAEWESKSRLLVLEEQDTTDFEKCLYSVEAPSFYCFGFLDGRIDHTLATFHVLTKYRERQLALFGSEDVVLPVSQSITFQAGPGDRVSIYPLTRCEFNSSQGLKYSLDGLVLEQGTSIGTSNEASQRKVEIELALGCYALILEIGTQAEASIFSAH